MKRAAILAMLVFLVGMAAAACGGGDSEVVDITEQELVEGVLASVDKQETWRFEMNLDGKLKGTRDGESGEMGLVMDSAGVINTVDQEMQTDMTMTMKIRAEGEQEQMTIPMRMYFLGGMAYIGTGEGPGQPEEWIKGNMSQELWESQELLSQQIDLLRGAEVRILKTESVRGTRCYVAEISPNMDVLLDMVNSLFESATGVAPTEDSIGNFKCSGWYAQDTYFLMQSRVEYDVTFEEGGNRLTGHYAANMVFYDHNEPVSLQLPPEAEDARYVGSLDW